MNPGCATPLDRQTLLAYWLGELDPEAEAGVEQHYLGCGQCSARSQELAAIANGVRALVQDGRITAVVTEPFVHRLLQRGLRVRQYRVPRNGSVHCTVAAEDDFVVARLEAPLEDVQRVDLESSDPEGGAAQRLEDIPFVADSGGVVLSTSLGLLHALPECSLRVRLLAMDGGSERTLGEYTFHHTPQEAGSS